MNAPRDSAIGFQLPTPGDITGMVSLGPGAGMLVFQANHTSTVRSPGDIDPERRNPRAQWVIEHARPYGSSHPAIARVLLQATDMMRVAQPGSILEAAATSLLVEISEVLVSCFGIADRVHANVAKIEQTVREQGVATEQGGRLVSGLPQVPDLLNECTQFLISARRVIRSLCRLVSEFMPLSRPDSDFEHMENRLRREGFGAEPITELIATVKDQVKFLVNLRNGQEHPTAQMYTRIDNVAVTPAGELTLPAWHVVGGEPNAPSPIAKDMRDATNMLLVLAENVAARVIYHRRLRGHFPLIFDEIAEAQRDPNRPIRYILRWQLA